MRQALSHAPALPLPTGELWLSLVTSEGTGVWMAWEAAVGLCPCTHQQGILEHSVLRWFYYLFNKRVLIGNAAGAGVPLGPGLHRTRVLPVGRQSNDRSLSSTETR